MLFKVRDLMIALLQDEQQIVGHCDAGPTRDCPGGCSQADTRFTPNLKEWAKDCEECSRACSNTRAPIRDSIADLMDLRMMLRLALARVEITLAEEQMRPQSLTEIDFLEKKLINAVEELRIQRESLQKSPKGG